MKFALLLLLLGVMTWSLSHLEPNTVAANAEQTASTGAVCQIAALPDGEVPAFTASVSAELLPKQMPNLQKAYFSMGCFWGSEGMLASCPGVEFTRVGFSGGSSENPSYSAIGDHVETVEVLFDPKLVTYPQLLKHFWAHHNARAKPVFRQYASAIFVTDDQQERQANHERVQFQRLPGSGPLLTAIQPLKQFYPADAGHQKHYLQQDSELLSRLPRYGEQKQETRIATKLNALVGRTGDRKQLKSSLVELGIDPEITEKLFSRSSWPAQ